MDSRFVRLVGGLSVVVLTGSCFGEPDQSATDPPCYSARPEITQLFTEPGGASVGAGGGMLDVEVTVWFETPGAADVVRVHRHLIDESGARIVDEVIEEHLGQRGSYNFVLLVPTPVAQTFRIRVRVEDVCEGASRWAETDFIVSAM